MSSLAKTLATAVTRASTLPEDDQEHIGRQLIGHIEKLRRLRCDIDEGLRSLDAGESRALDVEAFLTAQRYRHGGS